MAQSIEQQQMNLQNIPDRQGTSEYTLYVGAMSCMRHRGEEFYELQQQNKLAYLIFEEIDYITGDYLNKIQEAAAEVTNEFHPTTLKIAVGCQNALLSTDYGMLKQDLERELGISVVVDENCHLNGFDHHGARGGHGDRGDHGERGDRGGYSGRGDRGRHREGGGSGDRAPRDRGHRDGEGQRRDRRRFGQEEV